jgi:DnaJ-domain-containing protein 1
MSVKAHCLAINHGVAQSNGAPSMRTIEDLMTLAKECHDRARLESNPLTKAQFRVMGDDYWKQAEELKKQVRSATSHGTNSSTRSYH